MAKDKVEMTAAQRYAYAAGKLEVMKEHIEAWKRIKEIADNHLAWYSDAVVSASSEAEAAKEAMVTTLASAKLLAHFTKEGKE